MPITLATLQLTRHTSFDRQVTLARSWTTTPAVIPMTKRSKSAKPWPPWLQRRPNRQRGSISRR